MGLYPEGGTTAFYFEMLSVTTAAGGVQCATNAYPATGGVARRALIGPLEVCAIRYLYCATTIQVVTSGIGHLMLPGDGPITLEDNDSIRNFRAICVSNTSTGTLPITYER